MVSPSNMVIINLIYCGGTIAICIAIMKANNAFEVRCGMWTLQILGGFYTMIHFAMVSGL